MVRGPRPTKYCCGELKGVPAFRAEVALCLVPGQVHPPGSGGAWFKLRGSWNPSILGGEVTIVRAPQIRVMFWGPRTDAAGQTTGLCVRQLGSQALLFALSCHNEPTFPQATLSSDGMLVTALLATVWHT